MAGEIGKEIVYPISVHPPRPLSAVVEDLGRRMEGNFATTLCPIGTGFPLLDQHMSGGVHPEDLVLIGGIQGVGKTVLVLQMARAAAMQGRLSIVVCYEHSPIHLLFRLLCQESFWNQSGRLTWPDLRDTIIRLGGKKQGLDQLLLELPPAMEAWKRIREYMDLIWMVPGDGIHTTVDVLDLFVADAVRQKHESPILFVDYAQIVPVRPSPLGGTLGEMDRIGVVLKGLKSIAIRHQAVVVAVAAADEQALRRQRVHLEDLWGPALVQYQPDTAIILNRGGVMNGRTMIRVGLEKQRNGPQGIEFEFPLWGEHFCFDPQGRLVSEEESYQRDRIPMRA